MGCFRWRACKSLTDSWGCRLYGRRPTRQIRRASWQHHGSCQSHPLRMTAATIPASWASMNAAIPAGAIPAKVSESDRAIVTAGVAKDVEAVNQEAAVMEKAKADRTDSGSGAAAPKTGNRT